MPWPTTCPTCRGTVHHNHRCPGAPPTERPCPPPPNLRDLVAQARAEAARDAQTTHPLTLPLEIP